MNKNFFIFLILTILCSSKMTGQTQADEPSSYRYNTYEKIGWYNIFPTIKFSKKISLHTEYQWRRDNLITQWQQSLFRVGVNYQIKPNILLRAGYAWIETFPYGEVPINGMGKDFTEHRIYEMVQLAHKEGRLDFSHRFMLEQRFVGRYSASFMQNEDEFPLFHRMRYMCRLQIPIIGKEIKDKTPYIALYDEILIGFGNNVNNNIFDQNRMGALIGFRFNKLLRFEAGYLSQIVQFGRLIRSKPAFQNNNGIIMNANINLDFSKKEGIVDGENNTIIEKEK